MSAETTLAAERHLAEGQSLLKEEIKLRNVSNIPNRIYKTKSFQKQDRV
jgi:hypothetical protein